MKTALKTVLCAADWRFPGCGNFLMCLWLMLELLAEFHWEHVQASSRPASQFIRERIIKDISMISFLFSLCAGLS